MACAGKPSARRVTAAYVHTSRPAPRGPAAAVSARPGAAAPRVTDEAALALIQWAIQQRVQFAKVRPALFSSFGRGLEASFAIAPGEVLLAVPEAAAIRTRRGDAPPPGMADGVWADLPLFARLAAKLVHERAQGAASPWAAYLAFLPPRVDLPVLWQPDEVAQLQYPLLIRQVDYQAPVGPWTLAIFCCCMQRRTVVPRNAHPPPVVGPVVGAP